MQSLILNDLCINTPSVSRFYTHGWKRWPSLETGLETVGNTVFVWCGFLRFLRQCIFLSFVAGFGQLAILNQFLSCLRNCAFTDPKFDGDIGAFLLLLEGFLLKAPKELESARALYPRVPVCRLDQPVVTNPFRNIDSDCND
jgi:hypothetical protein